MIEVRKESASSPTAIAIALTTASVAIVKTMVMILISFIVQMPIHGNLLQRLPASSK